MIDILDRDLSNSADNSQVIFAVRELGLWTALHHIRDGQGRTPAMCLLGRKETPAEKEARKISRQEGSLGGNIVDLLGDNSDQETRRHHLTTIPRGGGSGGGDGGGSDHSGNLSGIMHAARGGRDTFELACRLIMTDDDLSGGLPLPVVLGLSPGSVEFDERCAQLLAQAALGGDVAVLDEILSSIPRLKRGYGDPDGEDCGSDPPGRDGSNTALSRYVRHA